MTQHINDVEFTIFDTETTGLDPASGDRIVEIAAVRFRGAVRLAEFQKLVNPHRPVSDAAFRVNGISSEMLKDAPDMKQVIPELLDFIRGSCLCSYNAAFDMEFLNNELTLLGLPHLEDIVVVDALKMSRRLMPGLERYALWFVSEKLGIRAQQAHRALSDVELTWEVFTRLKAILISKGISDFKSFTHLFTINPKLLEDINAQKVAQIQEAIDLGVRIRMRYLPSAGGDLSEREVIPKELKQDNKRDYLIGYCCLRCEERIFRLDGILHLEIL